MSAPISEKVHASILYKVAAKTLVEARIAQQAARTASDAKTLREAFRACVLGARCAGRAAEVWTGDTTEKARLLDDAAKLKVAADDLKFRLARAVDYTSPV